jgi:polar amino acid transport system substrate-binding protein
MPASAQSFRVAHPQLGVIISDQNGKTVGEVAEILNAVAARQQVAFTFVPLAGTTAQTLESGAADAVAPFLATPEASERYDFTATLMTTGGGLFVRAGATAPSDLRMLAGKTVVTPSFGPFVSYIHKNFPDVNVVTAASYEESLDRVLAGQADAAALNVAEGASVVARAYAGKVAEPTAAFMEESLVLAVLKGHQPELVRRVDAGLAAIRADGTLQRIEDKWARSPRS